MFRRRREMREWALRMGTIVDILDVGDGGVGFGADVVDGARGTLMGR